MTEFEEQEKVRLAALDAVSQIESYQSSPSTEDSEKEEKSTELTLVECPRCGHRLENREVIKPAEADVKEYFRCLMSGKTFTKNYALFDGELTVLFSMLTGDESELLSKALHKVEGVDFIDHASQAIRLKLLFYLRRWGNEEFSPPTTSDSKKLWAIWKKDFGSRGEDVPVLMIKVMLEFMRLTEMLPMAGLDENFYKGAGLS
jgi:hypothetical protein